MSEGAPLLTATALRNLVVRLFIAGALYFWSGHATFRWAAAAGLVVSLMHFWYDGFVWSVRRHEV